MHLPFEPLPGVLLPVWPALQSRTVLEVSDILANIGSAIRVREGALALHLLLHPLAVERAAVAPDVHAVAMDVVIVKLPCEVGAVGPQVVPDPVFAADDVLANVLGAVRPLLGTLAALAVVHPLASVLRAVVVQICSVPVLHVAPPLALIGRTVGMLQPTLAMSLVIYPLPLVHRAIRLDVDPVAVAHVARPLPDVPGAVFEDVLGPLVSVVWGLAEDLDHALELRRNDVRIIVLPLGGARRTVRGALRRRALRRPHRGGSRAPSGAAATI
mmetsp:Transcript_32970/g.87127  ORF Transcript_32970/g.87127 Transcript_32970/m.87127 type:complete len:271 (+) Transcript_32970:208-1020(+)